VGAFSLKFSIGDAKMVRTSSITIPSMVGILGRAPAVDEKVWCFYCLSVCLFVCLSRFGITKFVITETLWSSIYQNNYGVIACRKVCSCAPIFNFFFCGPQKFFNRGEFIPKIVIFRHFCGCRPTFLKPERWNLVWGCGHGTPSTKPNFVKKIA